VIFGASGDLTRRKILPALYNLAREGLLPERFAVVGYARTEWDTEAFREHARRAVEEFSRTPLDEEVWKPLSEGLSYVSGPFDDAGCFAPLRQHLEDLDEVRGTEGRRLYYCATPPSAFPVIVRRLGEAGSQEQSRILIEKPFGRDLGSARELNRGVHQVFQESQVFRIDHYLGKETVQNIVALRFANSLFERIWNRDAVDHVQVTVAEQVGLEGRGSYYEEAGALRDIVQNHVLQMVALLAMEPPRSLEADAIRDEKVKLLNALRPLDPEEVVRGQYERGKVDGEEFPGYCEEEGVGPDSQTETYAAARAWIENWRWEGVPFYLRTGKRLARRVTEVAVVLRRAPAYLFEGLGLPRLDPDHLAIRIQPDEGMSLAFHAKKPGPRITLQTVEMDFAYRGSFEASPAEAYERLLHDAMVGDQTLFTREDGVERAWEAVLPALERPGPIHTYPAGSWGPAAADELIAPRRWRLR
jgi:glucose-6-phosphate 1-dehydrogenase